eukprot:TRINITY_DN683_c0_g1_i1.p1 TRINITY_DN683_c0_g1~~TRINITY_DN683_c0_g1_i1.p1  ORF type:complete len:829 (-),score=215.50 TRINITY_DN683_c0_g1_i1:68-2263(-)
MADQANNQLEDLGDNMITGEIDAGVFSEGISAVNETVSEGLQRVQSKILDDIPVDAAVDFVKRSSGCFTTIITWFMTVFLASIVGWSLDVINVLLPIIKKITNTFVVPAEFVTAVNWFLELPSRITTSIVIPFYGQIILVGILCLFVQIIMYNGFAALCDFFINNNKYLKIFKYQWVLDAVRWIIYTLVRFLLMIWATFLMDIHPVVAVVYFIFQIPFFITISYGDPRAFTFGFKAMIQIFKHWIGTIFLYDYFTNKSELLSVYFKFFVKCPSNIANHFYMHTGDRLNDEYFENSHDLCRFDLSCIGYCCSGFWWLISGIGFVFFSIIFLIYAIFIPPLGMTTSLLVAILMFCGFWHNVVYVAYVLTFILLLVFNCLIFINVPFLPLQIFIFVMTIFWMISFFKGRNIIKSGKHLVKDYRTYDPEKDSKIYKFFFPPEKSLSIHDYLSKKCKEVGEPLSDDILIKEGKIRALSLLLIPSYGNMFNVYSLKLMCPCLYLAPENSAFLPWLANVFSLFAVFVSLFNPADGFFLNIVAIVIGTFLNFFYNKSRALDSYIAKQYLEKIHAEILKRFHSLKNMKHEQKVEIIDEIIQNLMKDNYDQLRKHNLYLEESLKYYEFLEEEMEKRRLELEKSRLHKLVDYDDLLDKDIANPDSKSNSSDEMNIEQITVAIFEKNADDDSITNTKSIVDGKTVIGPNIDGRKVTFEEESGYDDSDTEIIADIVEVNPLSDD